MKKITLLIISLFIYSCLVGFVGFPKWAIKDIPIYEQPNQKSNAISICQKDKELLVIIEDNIYAKVYSHNTGTWGYVLKENLTTIRPNDMPMPKLIDNESNVIRIGDSRVDFMYQNVSEEEKNKSSWIVEGGAGYDWLQRTVVPTIDSMNIKDKTIIIQLGVNDIIFHDLNYAKENYSNFYKTKAIEWNNRGANVYFDYVWPIYRKATNNIKINSISCDDFFSEYNNYIVSILPKEINIMNFNQEIINQKQKMITTIDGIHFIPEDYIRIYNFQKYILIEKGKN